MLGDHIYRNIYTMESVARGNARGNSKLLFNPSSREYIYSSLGSSSSKLHYYTANLASHLHLTISNSDSIVINMITQIAILKRYAFLY